VTKLILIRHAQSANNALPESQRVPDPGLTELGHQQAEALAEHLIEHPPTHIYCSAFRRALETTLPIVDRSKVIPEVRWDLFEQGGCYEGYIPGRTKPSSGMGRRQIQELFGDWKIDPQISDQGWYQGHPLESDEMAMARAERVANWLTQTVAPMHQVQETPSKIACVIHADFKVLLLQSLMKYSTSESQIEFESFYHLGHEPWNTSITELNWRGSHWQLVSLNQAPHLGHAVQRT
jgi:2,3-bisphosphoglycerate-dependent phosphoglycerate mutase